MIHLLTLYTITTGLIPAYDGEYFPTVADAD